MGTKYSSVSVTGYNASPPADDGSAVSANQVKWSTIKTKLPDPLKTALESINSNLATFADFGSRQVTADDTTLATDHMKTIEIGSGAASTVTISLGDATTMASGYIVTIKNSCAVQCIVGRATGGNTIDGAAANYNLPPGASATFKLLSTNYQVTSDYKSVTSVTNWTVTGTLTGPTGLWNSSGLYAGASSAVWDERISAFRTTSAVSIGAYSSSNSYASSVVRMQTETAGSTSWKLLDGRSSGGTIVFSVFGNGAIDAAGRVTLGGATAATNYTAAGAITCPATVGVRALNTVKAWCFFDGSNTGTFTPTSGFCVDSVVRNGAGDYTIMFTAGALADANYAVSGACRGTSAGIIGMVTENQDNVVRSTSALRILAIRSNDGGVIDSTKISVVIYGN